MRPTLCQDTLVPIVDAVILRHKGLDEKIVLILCCKTSAGFDFTQEQLLVSPRQVGDITWWEARRREGDGVTEPRVSLRSHSPRLGEMCGRSCDSFTYPMPTCWSKLRNSSSPPFFFTRKLVIGKAKANVQPHLLYWWRAHMQRGPEGSLILLEAKGSQGRGTERKYLTSPSPPFKMQVANRGKVGAKVIGTQFHLSIETMFCRLIFSNILPAVCPATSIGFPVSVKWCWWFEKNTSIVYIDLIMARTWSNSASFLEGPHSFM